MLTTHKIFLTIIATLLSNICLAAVEDNIKEKVNYQSILAPRNIISQKIEIGDTPTASDTDTTHTQITNKEHLKIEVSKKTNNPDFMTLLDSGYRALKLGQVEAAKRYYRQANKMDKSSIEAGFGLATCYHKAGQFNLAKKLYSAILKQDPTHQLALNNFLILVGREAKDSAILQFKKLEAINPYNSIIPAQIAMIYLQNKNYIKAAKYLRKAITLDPSNITYQYNLAISLDSAGDNTQAIQQYQLLLEKSYEGGTLPSSNEMINQRIIYLSSKN